MKKINSVILKIIWSFYTLSLGWNILFGDIIAPTHPLNIALIIAFFCGAITIWVPFHKAQFIASLCGILMVAIIAFQTLTLMRAFSFSASSATFSMRVGPVTLVDTPALFAFWLPLLIFFFCSLVLLVNEGLYFASKRPAAVGNIGSGISPPGTPYEDRIKQYSLAELESALHAVDKDKYPENHKLLILEKEKRNSNQRVDLTR